MNARTRISAIVLSFVAFVSLVLCVPAATKGGFFVLYGLRLKVNDQVRVGDEFEAQVGLVFAVLLLLVAALCLLFAARLVRLHLTRWDWLWLAVALLGGLALGLNAGQVHNCLIYFPVEVCRPDRY
ncbi:hypothetical protein ACXR2W_12205 [Leucobacter sp. HY1908]